MASFLQNNGDIILDAVLTDYGRKLLAKGDGSFNIVKFAFGDDEIDYGLFNTTASSMNQDADIMSTPILEAFTNNAASMKSQLLTIGIENTLFLPVLKLNTSIATGKTNVFNNVFEGFVVPVDTTVNKTTDALSASAGGTIDGVLTSVDNRFTIVDQGLDSNKLDKTKNLKTENPALYESEYNVFVDSHFCSISNNSGGTLSPLSVDDDGIAVYKLTEQSTVNNVSYVSEIVYKASEDSIQVILGTKGSRLQFRIIPNNNLYVDTYFDKLGKELVLNNQQPTKTFKTLRMPVRVVGVTTGYSLEIPVMFAKVKP